MPEDPAAIGISRLAASHCCSRVPHSSQRLEVAALQTKTVGEPGTSNQEQDDKQEIPDSVILLCLHAKRSKHYRICWVARMRHGCWDNVWLRTRDNFNRQVERSHPAIRIDTVHLRGVVTFRQTARNPELRREGPVGRHTHIT